VRNREARRSTPDDAEVDNEDGVRWNTPTVTQHSIDRKTWRRSGTTPLSTALPSLKEAADGSGRNRHIGVMTMRRGDEPISQRRGAVVEMVDGLGVVAVIGSPKANGGRRKPRAPHDAHENRAQNNQSLPLPTRSVCAGSGK
jgi:hypothetical protein